MSQRYKLVKRKNLGKDKEQTTHKYYAQCISNGYVTFDELCEDISETCTLTSADVKAVLDRMNQQLDRHLKAGRIVQFGEIGNFRMAFGSSGSTTEDTFSTSQLRTPKIVFVPGKRLRAARTNTTYERISIPTVIEPEDPPSNDGYL